MPEVSLPIATALASILLAWLFVLSLRVITARRSGGASLGDGGEKDLQRRIRAQANLTEYAPLFVALIAILELQQGNAFVLATLSIVFLIGRLGHGYALSFTAGSSIGRVGGMGLTLGAIVLAAIYGIVSLVI